MAIYKRRTLAKRRTYRKKVGVARKALRMVKAIKRTYRPEYKKIDLGAVANDVGTTANTQLLHGIAQGDTNITRNGNNILIKSVSMKGWIQHNNTATVGQMVKMWLIADKQQIGDTTPTAADIWQVAASSVTAPLNRDTTGRFKILWSKTYTVDPGNEIRPIYMYKRLTHPVKYNGTTGADIQKNGLYLFMASTDDTNKPQVNTNIRTTFLDN